MGTLIIGICVLIGVICGLLYAATITLHLIVKSNAFGIPKSKKEEEEQALKPDLHYYEIEEGHKILFF